jgi:hypothetical protein
VNTDPPLTNWVGYSIRGANFDNSVGFSIMGSACAQIFGWQIRFYISARAAIRQ